MTSAISKIVAGPVPPEVKVLAFEIQSDWDCFPVMAFAMDDKAPNEMYFKRPYYGEVLPRCRAIVPHGSIDQDKYEDQGVATFESGAKLLAEWFGELWQSAGGQNFPIPAYINHHDRSSYFDLRKRKWVRDTDVWR